MKANLFGKSVTIFGSARTKEKENIYRHAEELGSLLAHRGYSVITGGGPGIMEAANKGAFLSKGISVGMNISLPTEQVSNGYQTHSFDFDKFYERKVALVRYSQAFVVFPGGYGTMDELFEVATLIQTRKIPRRPIILFEKYFWHGLSSWIANVMRPRDMVDYEDMKLVHLTDRVDEALEIIERNNLEESTSDLSIPDSGDSPLLSLDSSSNEDERLRSIGTH